MLATFSKCLEAVRAVRELGDAQELAQKISNKAQAVFNPEAETKKPQPEQNNLLSEVLHVSAEYLPIVVDKCSDYADAIWRAVKLPSEVMTRLDKMQREHDETQRKINELVALVKQRPKE